MKCPYRKITKTEHQYNSDITTEEFAECYGTVCPLYEENYRRTKGECIKAREEAKA
jgi:hypothetical protein